MKIYKAAVTGKLYNRKAPDNITTNKSAAIVRHFLIRRKFRHANHKFSYDEFAIVGLSREFFILLFLVLIKYCTFFLR